MASDNSTIYVDGVKEGISIALGIEVRLIPQKYHEPLLVGAHALHGHLALSGRGRFGFEGLIH